MGYETMVFDVRDMAQGLKHLSMFAAKPVKAVITFNNLGFNIVFTMTWFKDGTHDRVFNGMLQGAVAISDASGYMKEEFCGICDVSSPEGDGRELVLFELEELEKLPPQAEELLCNPQKAQQIADRGYAKARRLHTWKARALELEKDLLMQL